MRIKVCLSRCIPRIRSTRSESSVGGVSSIRLECQKVLVLDRDRKNNSWRWTWIVESDAARPADRCPTLFRWNRTSFADNIAAEKNGPGAESYAVQDPLLRARFKTLQNYWSAFSSRIQFRERVIRARVQDVYSNLVTIIFWFSGFFCSKFQIKRIFLKIFWDWVQISKIVFFIVF